jgi:uncharacterized small protein (DUF1192 family)
MPKSSKKDSDCSSDILSGIGSNYRSALAILKTAAEAGRKLAADEKFQLSSLVAWSGDEADRQLRKVESRIKFQRIAGSDEDRQAASQAVSDCESILEKRGAQIQAEVERLQAEFAKLQAERDRAAKRLEEMLNARQASRLQMPSDLKKLVERKRGEVKVALFPKVAEVETELNRCRAMVDFKSKNSNDIQLLPKEFWTHHPIDRRAVLKPEFAIYQAECESKIPQLEADLATAQAELDAALQSFDSSLDCLTL